MKAKDLLRMREGGDEGLACGERSGACSQHGDEEFAEGEGFVADL